MYTHRMTFASIRENGETFGHATYNLKSACKDLKDIEYEKIVSELSEKFKEKYGKNIPAPILIAYIRTEN